MIKRFLKFMGLNANNIKSPSRKSSGGVPNIELEKQEVEILLTSLQSSTFSGDLIEPLFILVTKLKEHHKKL
jgi:hypothetical protein